MKSRNAAWGIGLLMCGLSACTPSIRPLGDEPSEGGDESGGDTGGPNMAGTGTVLPQGGSGNSGTGGSGGMTPNQGGAGGTASGMGGNNANCFSPTNSAALAIEVPEAGCPCSKEPDECVLTEYDSRPWLLSFSCQNGKWESVEDGVCGDGRQSACRVDGVTYPHGARNIPSPFDECNHCSCGDGQLVDCTIIECGDIECGEGSYPARRCVECGPTDACLEVETGCLSGPGCENGFCDEGRCG